MNFKLTLITILCPFVVFADAASGDGTWSYRECVDYAYSHNISLKKETQKINSGLLETERAKAQWLPSVDFATTHGYTKNVGSGAYSGTYGINASWTVWNGGERNNTIKLNELQNRVDEYSVEYLKNNLEIEILTAYLDILYNKESVQIASRAADVSKAQMQRALEMMNSGKISRVDYVRLEAQYRSDYSNLVTAKGKYATAKTDLKQILQLGISENFEIEECIPSDSLLSQFVIPDKCEVYNIALNWLPQLQSAKLSVNMQDYNIKIARSKYLPSVTLNAGLGTSTNSDNGGSWGSQMGDAFNAQVAVTLSVPIIDKKEAKTATKKSEIEKITAELDYLELQSSITKTIEQLFVDADNNKASYDSCLKQVESSELTEKLTIEQFNLGLVNTVELLTAHADYITAQLSLLQSKYMMLLCIKMIDFYQNKLISL